MSNIVPRVAAIHDISGFGRCSLTVIIPVMSALGIQVCPLPTAVLSTHTGGFTDFEFVDLTRHLDGFAAHWKRLGLEFDCIYSGFLGSARQFSLVETFIDDFGGRDTLVVVDPVFADHGQLYQTYTPDMVNAMKQLVRRAHIITPNFTEAAYLLHEKLPETVDTALVKDWLVRLSGMNPHTTVITSVPLKGFEGQLSACAYSRGDGRFWKVSCDYIPAEYPGTGDTFTSILTAFLLKGESLAVALDRAVSFVTQAINITYSYGTPQRDGVIIEKALPLLHMPHTTAGLETL